MMGVWRRIKRDLLLAMTGLQETTIEVADRVNQRVQEVKVSIEANELEQQVKNNQAILGEKVYQQPDLDLDHLFKDPDLNMLFTRIRECQNQLEIIEGQILTQETLFDLEQTLIRSGMSVQNVVIRGGFHGIGKRIRDLSLPPQMLILLVKKKNEIKIAHGETIIDLHDRITFLCLREKIKKYLEFWD